MDRFNTLLLFVRVVESGSFSQAARDLGIGQPAVSKQIAALEARLGVPLLTRTSRMLNVTSAGQLYYESARRLLGDFEEAEERVAGGQLAPSGRVRVTSSPAFGRMYIVPRLGEFRSSYPEISIDMEVSGRRTDLIEEGIDVAIRIGHLPDTSLVARRIGDTHMFTVASADYVQRRGAPTTPAELIGHDKVTYMFHGEEVGWGFKGPDGPLTLDVTGGFRTNDAEHVRAAVLSGLGIAHQASWLFTDLLGSGEVVRLLAPYEPNPFPIHAMIASGRRMPARVRLFVDFLTDVCGAEPELQIGGLNRPMDAPIG